MTTAQTFDLSGKLVLVTGATRGIGRAVTIGAAAAGAELIITGRTTGALEEVDDTIRKAGSTAGALAATKKAKELTAGNRTR